MTLSLASEKVVVSYLLVLEVMMLRSLCQVARPLLLLVVATPVLAQTGGASGGVTPKSLIGDSVSNADDPRYKDVAEAIKRFVNRDQLSARTFLERAVASNKKLPPVGVLMARLQLLSGNTGAVRTALEQAVQEDSADDPEPYLLLAEEAVASKRAIEADALFDKAVAKINAYSASAKRKRLFKIRALRGRAAIAQGRRDWDQAESDLRAWIAEDPESSTAHNLLGQTLFMSDDAAKVSEGFNELKKAEQLRPELPDPYATAAQMYTRLGDTDQAMKFFEQAYKSSSEELTTLVPYAQMLMQNGDLAKAGKVLRQAQKINADARAVWLLSGVVARMTGDTATAEKNLMRGLAIAPGDRDVLNQLALTLTDSSEEGAAARALQFAQVNQRLYSNNPDINITLAWVLYRNGDARNATAALRQGVQGGALSPGGSFLLAKLLIERGDNENAKRLLESALKSEQGIFVERKEAEKLLSGL